MMTLALAAIATLLLVTAPQSVSSFSPRFDGLRSSKLMAALDEEPFFEMRQIPTATTGAKLDRIVDCAEHEGCDVGEMINMIDGTHNTC
jgi:hypothetical protein